MNLMKRKVDYMKNMMVAVNSLTEIQDDIANLNNELSIIDKKEQDILHIIENVTANASEGYSLFRQLKEIRNERREIKNRIEESNEIRDFIKAFKSVTRNAMEKKVKAIEGVRKEQSVRTYKLKELKHLENFNIRGNKRQK